MLLCLVKTETEPFDFISVSISQPQADLPEEASNRSSLLISQSSEPENWAQFFLFPLISAAGWRTADRGEERREEKKCTNRLSYYFCMSVLNLCPLIVTLFI